MDGLNRHEQDELVARLQDENARLTAAVAELQTDRLRLAAERDAEQDAVASAQAAGAVKMRDLIVDLLRNSARDAIAIGSWGKYAGKFMDAKADFISEITGEEAAALGPA